MIRAVVFDVGETLLDDTREFGAWADWIGVPRHTFSAVLGAVTSQGRNNAETFQYFRPGFNLEAERARREIAGLGEHISEADLYSDVRPALSRLRARGLWVGVAGNQTARAAHLLRSLHLPVDAIATSGEWGVMKPDAAFFDRVAEFVPCDRTETVGTPYRNADRSTCSRVMKGRSGRRSVGVIDTTAPCRRRPRRGRTPLPPWWARLPMPPRTTSAFRYVGDHRDNDLVPSHKAGFRAALIRRGPWGYLWADDPLVHETADWVVDALPELVELLAPTD